MRYAATVDVTDEFMDNVLDPEGTVRMILARRLEEEGAELETLDRIRLEFDYPMPRRGPVAR